MSTMSLEEAQTRLPDIINKLIPGEEVVITRNSQPVARLIGEKPPVRQPRKPGDARGKLVIHSEDEEHLHDFKDYMP